MDCGPTTFKSLENWPQFAIGNGQPCDMVRLVGYCIDPHCPASHAICFLHLYLGGCSSDCKRIHITRDLHSSCIDFYKIGQEVKKMYNDLSINSHGSKHDTMTPHTLINQPYFSLLRPTPLRQSIHGIVDTSCPPQCPICFDSSSTKSNPFKKLSCNHYLHLECLDLLKKESLIKRDCPLCRHALSKSDLQVIFPKPSPQ